MTTLFLDVKHMCLCVSELAADKINTPLGFRSACQHVQVIKMRIALECRGTR